MNPNRGFKLLNHGIWQLSYHQGKRLPNKEKMKNNMKTYESKACFMPTYHHVTTTILQQLPSCNKLEKRSITTYRPSIATTYHL